jgi:hypothetical protein
MIKELPAKEKTKQKCKNYEITKKKTAVTSTATGNIS